LGRLFLLAVCIANAPVILYHEEKRKADLVADPSLVETGCDGAKRLSTVMLDFFDGVP